MATYIAQAYDSKGRPFDDEALSLTTQDKGEAVEFYDWLVKHGEDAKLLSVS